MIDETTALSLIARVMIDERPVRLDMPLGSAWVLLSALQLATRHPELGASIKSQIEFIARQLQRSIVFAHPEIAELAEAGWNVDLDR